MDELLQRYTDPASCPGALPARLKPIEIAKLAYPDDESRAFQFAAILLRAIESGELESAGTVIERFLSSPPKSVPRPVVDRAAFGAFLRRQGIKPEGRIAEWVQPRSIESEPIKAKIGRPARVTDEAADYAKREIGKGRPKTEVHCETIKKFDLDVKPDAVRKRLTEQ